MGTFLSQGTYGQEQKTEVYAAPISLRWKSWPYTLKLSSSWVHVNGGSVVGDVTGPTTNTKRNESGLGDSTVSVNRGQILGKAKQWYVDYGLKLKVPSGDEEKGLGTGSTDWEPNIWIVLLNKDWRPFAKISHRVRGDSDTYDLINSWRGTTGFDFKFNDRFTAGSQLSISEPSQGSGSNKADITLFSSYKVNTSYGISTFLSAGLSDGSADSAIGLNLNIFF